MVRDEAWIFWPVGDPRPPPHQGLTRQWVLELATTGPHPSCIDQSDAESEWGMRHPQHTAMRCPPGGKMPGFVAMPQNEAHNAV